MIFKISNFSYNKFRQPLDLVNGQVKLDMDLVNTGANEAGVDKKQVKLYEE